jgi:hypothetical protein
MSDTNGDESDVVLDGGIGLSDGVRPTLVANNNSTRRHERQADISMLRVSTLEMSGVSRVDSERSIFSSPRAFKRASVQCHQSIAVRKDTTTVQIGATVALTINLPNANFVNDVPQYLWTINEEYTATVTVTTGEGTNDVKSGTASYVFNTQSVPYIEGSKPFASASGVSEPYVQGVTKVTLHAGDWTTEASGSTGLTYVFFRVSSFGPDVILSSQSSTNTFTTYMER